jgi:hypothetical protein
VRSDVAVSQEKIKTASWRSIISSMPHMGPTSLRGRALDPLSSPRVN